MSFYVIGYGKRKIYLNVLDSIHNNEKHFFISDLLTRPALSPFQKLNLCFLTYAVGAVFPDF
jgi:hypothetical protein